MDVVPPKTHEEKCVGPESEQAGKAEACQDCPNKTICETKPKGPDPDLAEISERMSKIKHKILVLSGKGGVGKSTFSSQLTLGLADLDKDVGILDIDICGPSIPKILGLEKPEDAVHMTASGWEPVYPRDNLAVMSVGFLLNSVDDAVIWRGPKKNGLIKQFLKDVLWDEMDYLIVDTPPGTSDEHLSITQYLKNGITGAVVITTPQEVSLVDVRKEINFCRKVGIPIIGVVENMSGFVCPKCKNETKIFLPSTGGAVKMCRDLNVNFLGSIPLDPLIARCCDEGKSFILQAPESPASKAYFQIINRIIGYVENGVRNFEQ
eukprot:TRINITY_DN9594_c0_g1_i1.p1 TRINITY_DN9594_c0_g1~~TRINITY_DN9594_c0_g1_i1.p1  ORF type:complete len:321 (+),score=55.16 TRINITY_DN9594_c0_g1_i1:68-1030(+)